MSTIFIITNGEPGEYGYEIKSVLTDRGAAIDKVAKLQEADENGFFAVKEMVSDHECADVPREFPDVKPCNCYRTYSTWEQYNEAIAREAKWLAGAEERAVKKPAEDVYLAAYAALTARKIAEMKQIAESVDPKSANSVQESFEKRTVVLKTFNDDMQTAYDVMVKDQSEAVENWKNSKSVD